MDFKIGDFIIGKGICSDLELACIINISKNSNRIDMIVLKHKDKNLLLRKAYGSNLEDCCDICKYPDKKYISFMAEINKYICDYHAGTNIQYNKPLCFVLGEMLYKGDKEAICYNCNENMFEITIKRLIEQHISPNFSNTKFYLKY